MLEFVLPGGPLSPDAPMAESHFYQWARKQPRADVSVVKYLKAHGFIVGAHKISESEYDSLRCMENYFHWSAPHIAEPLQFSDAFNPAESGGFWVQGKPGRWNPQAVILDSLTRAGWIYDITPTTTYFCLDRGRLFAKYQQILGARNLATIIGD